MIGKVLGFVTVLSSIPTIILSPYFGAVSDTYESRFGRRRPFVLVGSILSALFIVIMAAFNPQTHFEWFVFFWVLANVAVAIGSSPYSAIIPDIVPPSQYGASSGWFGMMQMIGNVFGVCEKFFFCFLNLSLQIEIFLKKGGHGPSL